ncbi:MAG: GNAT family N-acetyltransferase [Phycisphaerales bacterium]|nr:GNAT family N-acetyltransferase [Phycisphaerales bacterium]
MTVPSVEMPSAWSAEFEPPHTLVTSRVRLEPLGPRHAERDYKAFMGSQAHLQRTLHWGSWPNPSFTLEQNRSDLARHEGEFKAHEAYAYTVLSPDGSEALGCIYLDPDDPDDETTAVNPRHAMLSYWVTEDQLSTDLDRHLVSSVLTWIRGEFPIDVVRMPTHIENERGIEVLQRLGLEEVPSRVDDHRVFIWTR